MLYQATLSTYEYGEGHTGVETRTFGTLKHAEMWARRVLPEGVTTTRDRYWQDMARISWVDVHRIQKGVRSTSCVAQFAPTMTIVPSVGELGYY